MPSDLLSTWLSIICPFKGLGQDRIEVRYEAFQLALQVRFGDKIAVPKQLTTQYTKPDLDLIQPGTVFRRVHKVHSMSGRTEKNLSADHTPQHTRLPFNP